MKFTMEHKLNEEQVEDFKAEFGEALEDLKKQLDETFVGWERTKKIVSYTIVGVAAGSFGLGYFVGRSHGN